MKTSRKLIIAGLLTTLTFGLAGCFKHTPEERAEWMTDRVTSKLDLNEEQKVKLVAVKDEVLKARADFQTDREQGFGEMKGLVLSEKLDTEKVKVIFNSKYQKMEKHADPVLDKLADFHSSLTLEQKNTIIAFMDDHKDDKRWGHHANW